MRWSVVVIALAACSRGGGGSTLGALRPACGAGLYWDGACKPRGIGAKKVAEGKTAIDEQNPEAAIIAFDEAVARGGPLDHETNKLLWEQHGIADAFLGNQTKASESFAMLLALDPTHFLSYRHKPQVTLVFEQVRNRLEKVGAPAIDLNWPSGQKVGDPMPLEVQVLADPKRFLYSATVFVRERGQTEWRAADLAIDGKREARVVLPPIEATRPTSLEVYVRAYDERRNEVLAWADPARPREIPLRYDPPPRWYQDWRTYVIGGSTLAVVTGVVVYALTVAPPDRVGGDAVLK